MRQTHENLDVVPRDRDLRLAAQAIRGPAMQLLGRAERLPAGEISDDAALAIRAIAQDLLNLSDDLQDDATDTDAEHLSIEPELVVLGPLLRHVAASVSALLCGRRHWRIAPVVEALALRADRRALHQVFMRVMSNAARFSGDGDWIDIDATVADDEVTISVLDEGHAPGVGTGVSSDRRGLGLGLVLSRNLMHAHGGRLAVETAPGIGTCVTLRFPGALLVETAG